MNDPGLVASQLNSREFLIYCPITKTTKNTYNIEKDQLWKLPKAHIKIVNVGRHLTHFKHSKTLDQKRVSTQIQTIAELQKYLKQHRGKLVKEHSLKKAA